MLVDDNTAVLRIGKNVLQDLFEIYTLPSAVRMFELLETVTPDLILLDIEMPELDGFQAIRRLKGDARFASIPIIFLTSRTDETSELKGLSLGAIDYITKPFSAPLLLRRVENQLLAFAQEKAMRAYALGLESRIRQKADQLVAMKNAIISSIAEMVEFRHSQTGGHVTRTQRYLKLLIDRMRADNVYRSELDDFDLKLFVQSAQLHDIGKIAIRDKILNKPGKLTQEEFEEIQTHVPLGVEAIERIERSAIGYEYLRHARAVTDAHHEKWDGSGYPRGLQGEAIPLEGRLMAIADVYDALISERPYKRSISAEVAARIIEDGRARHFDPMLVDVFHEISGEFAAISRCI
jgi:putative two-component system response regulator